MSDDHGDPWSRLIRYLQERQKTVSGQVMAGGCQLAEYHDLCGRHEAYAEILSHIDAIRRGEDVKRPQRRAYSVEE